MSNCILYLRPVREVLCVITSVSELVHKFLECQYLFALEVTYTMIFHLFPNWIFTPHWRHSCYFTSCTFILFVCVWVCVYFIHIYLDFCQHLMLTNKNAHSTWTCLLNTSHVIDFVVQSLCKDVPEKFS